MTASAKPLLALKKTPVFPARHPPLNHRQQLGAQGEQRATQYLQSLGYQLLDSNFRTTIGEIDIVMFDSQAHEIVFIEVKTRSSLKFGHPTQAVNYRKRAALYRTALAWIKQTKHREPFRFDVVSVIDQQIEHYPNISW